MELVRVIAQNIQNLLDEKNVTTSRLSEELDVSRQTLTNYLKGVSTIDSVRLVQIAKFFNVPVEDLLTDQAERKPAILFRSALHYEDAVDEVEQRVSDYLYKYEALAKRVGKNICYLPEQYNLALNDQGNIIDINFECQDYFASKLKIDPALDREISRIADSQRALLGLENRGAISLIQALTSRGINIIFLDLQTTEISGLSICDESRGCFIFVNSNSEMTYERQLFTIGHEYGHVVLHRPIFNRRLRHNTKGNKKSLLDAMADSFAARLLCPHNMLRPYADQFAAAGNDLTLILSAAMPLKRSLEISMQSVILGLKKYNFIPSEVVPDYFAHLDETGTRREEPMPISGDKKLEAKFVDAKRDLILRMLKADFSRGHLNVNDISYFLGCTPDEAKKIFEQFRLEREAVLQAFGDFPEE